MATDLSLYAIGTGADSLASYDVQGATDLTTIDGKKPVGTLQPQQNAGASSGILVFDIEGKLPSTADVLHEYKLVLSGATGRTDAPQRRTVKIGGEVELRY